MTDAPSGGPRAGAHSKAGTSSGGVDAIPTPANNISGGGREGPESSHWGGDNSCMHLQHGHMAAGSSHFTSLESQKKAGEEGNRIGRPENHNFATRKPAPKSLLGKWIEKGGCKTIEHKGDISLDIQNEIDMKSIFASATLRRHGRRVRSVQWPNRQYSNGRPRVSEIVKYDHQEIESHFYHIIDSSSEDLRTRFQNQFVWELARHTVAEELLLYPAFESYLENGKVLADRDRQEHQNIKIMLRQFQDMKAYNPHFIPTVKSLMRDLSLHMREEEATDLPALEKALSEQESGDLCAAFLRTKLFAPSRSHPMGPNKPPFETAYGLMTAPIDLLGDLFRKFPPLQ